MAAGRIIVPPYFPARDRNGDLMSGALLYVYINEGTTDLATIYTDEALSTPAANPVVANTSGQFPSVWAEAGTEADPTLYRVAVTTSEGGSPGNAFVFDDYRPSVDFDTATAALAEAAAASAEADRIAVEAAIDTALEVGGGAAALAGALAGATAGTAAANVVVAGKANVTLDNAAWLTRSQRQNSGSSDFSTSDTFWTWSGGASADAIYIGRKWTGTLIDSVSGANLGKGATGFMVDVRYDSATITGETFGKALHGRIVMTGATKGGRLGVFGEIDQQHISDPTNTNRNYVGTNGIASTFTGDGGTDLGNGARGAYFGNYGACFLKTGAVNVLDAVGAEFNSNANTGATVRYFSGITVANGSKIHGTDIDAGVRITSLSDAFGLGVGWNHGIIFTDSNGGSPFHSGSTAIGVKWINTPGVPQTITRGIDWRLLNFSGPIIETPTFLLDDGTFQLKNPQSQIDLNNGVRTYQVQALTADDHLRFIIGGIGDGLNLHADGRVNFALATSRIQINGTQVVGPRGAAVTDAVAAAAAPTQAEFNALVTQFNALLARVRAHGLIA